MESNVNFPSFLEEEFPLHWQMARPEKYALLQLLEVARPQVALEIGTYKGGSLQVLAGRAGKVYSIDIDPRTKDALAGRFGNVEFLCGDSAQLVPQVLDAIESRGEALGFVLVDGDHSTEGVRRDIQNILRYKPRRPLYILMHDGFHPPCRRGMLSVDWAACPYVHFVEIDFIPGTFHFDGFDTARPRSMYGGFALALMQPEPRSEDLKVHQSHRGLFETVYGASRHKILDRFDFIIRPLKWLKRRTIGRQFGR